MQPAIYITDSRYILSQTTTETKVAAIDAVIDNLYAQLLALAQQEEPVTEFMLNDGQTIVKGIYKSTTSIENTISVLTRQRNRLVNNSKGRAVQLVDKSNFNGRKG